MICILGLFLLAGSISAASVAGPRSYTTFESLSHVPAGFVLRGPAASDALLDMRIALVSNNITGLESELYSVSDPANLRYGSHLSKEQVQEYVQPTLESLALVTSWLEDYGISPESISLSGNWLHLSIPISKANKLLKAEFSVYTRKSDGLETKRTLSYSIPTSLQNHINVIHPTTSFPSPVSFMLVSPSVTKRQAPHSSAKNSSAAIPASCATAITPACLEALYGIPSKVPSVVSPLNSLAITSFDGQIPSASDLKIFLREFRPDLPANTTFKLQPIGSGPTEISIEANLEVDYTVGLAAGVPVTFLVVESPNSDSITGFLDVVNFILGLSSPPSVLVTSFGFDETTVSVGLATELCNAYMQLGARGISVLFASGDGGVAGTEGQSCTTFVPTFPSTCPFVTSVGATTGIKETAAPFSAGGFSSSSYFTAPSYQLAATQQYISSIGTLNEGLYNPSGRGFPDVSAQGENFEIVFDGEVDAVSSTAASGVVWASVVGLLNEELIAVGKPPLGFLNPFLYSAVGSAALNDITTGDNPGCNTNGFPALSGWDPVTGLGTPNFAKLAAALGL